MNNRWREFLIFLLIAAGVFIVQQSFRLEIISYTPVPILLAVILTWCLPQAWRYLIFIALVSELFTTLPPGILSLSIFIPLIVYWLRGRIEADISFSFLSIILVTVLLQLVVLSAFDIGPSALLAKQSIFSMIPWRLLISSWLISSAFSFAACVMITNHMPQPERQNVVSFTLTRPRG